MFPSPSLFSIVSQPFKRSQLGLFQGKTKQYGNNVPFSKHKTRRTWLPNVQRKRLYSETLGEDVRVKVTTSALRTIKKHRGLDNYLETTRSDLLGWQGMRLRLKIREHRERQAQESSPVCARSEALRELEAIATEKPSLEAAESRRDMVMKALNLNSRPTAQETIAFLKEQRKKINKTAFH